MEVIGKDDKKDDENKIDFGNIKLLWYTFVEAMGIEDLDTIPSINSENECGPDTKVAMYIYSMESFLYSRINEVSRNQNCPSI
jgi:hypothetical protein